MITTIRQPHTLEEIKNSCKMIVGENGQLLEVCRVTEELIQGLEELSKYEKLVTIYGSARFHEGTHPMARAAKELGERLVTEAGAGVITGGGPGIMASANRGAFEAGGVSIGATIIIPHEQTTNPYVNKVVPFQYFFTRKTALRVASEMAVCFPGGFGTFDEFFDLLTLIQTKKIVRIPLVLFGTEFWGSLDAYIKMMLEDKMGTISPEDRNLYIITDSIDDVIEIAKMAPTKETKINRDE